jgi:hypothetical protein
VDVFGFLPCSFGGLCKRATQWVVRSFDLLPIALSVIVLLERRAADLSTYLFSYNLVVNGAGADLSQFTLLTYRGRAQHEGVSSPGDLPTETDPEMDTRSHQHEHSHPPNRLFKAIANAVTGLVKASTYRMFGKTSAVLACITLKYRA